MTENKPNWLPLSTFTLSTVFALHYDSNDFGIEKKKHFRIGWEDLLGWIIHKCNWRLFEHWSFDWARNVTRYGPNCVFSSVPPDSNRRLIPHLNDSAMRRKMQEWRYEWTARNGKMTQTYSSTNVCYSLQNIHNKRLALRPVIHKTSSPNHFRSIH